MKAVSNVPFVHCKAFGASARRAVQKWHVKSQQGGGGGSAGRDIRRKGHIKKGLLQVNSGTAHITIPRRVGNVQWYPSDDSKVERRSRRGESTETEVKQRVVGISGECHRVGTATEDC